MSIQNKCGQITEYKKINIGGIDVDTYVIKFEKDKANGMVPVNKQSHLRPLIIKLTNAFQF